MTNEELEKARTVLEKEFGADWKTIVQTLGTEDLRTCVGKELTSFMAFPDRGTGGDNKWRGNCSPEVIRSIAKYVIESKKYYGKDTTDFTILDPMSGSGTTKKVADDLGVRSVLYDLNPAPAYGKGGWDALKNDVEDSADMVFWHPPYHDIIKYSGEMWGKPDPDDLSRCENYDDFIEKLNFVMKKLYMALRKDGRLAVLVGDIRSHGEFHSMQRDMMKIGNFESFIVKAQFNCVSSSRTYSKPFVPIVTEYVMIMHKDDIFMVPFSVQKNGYFDIRTHDCSSLTWHHLIRMTMEEAGGEAKLSDLYDMLADHPKAKANEHFKERIRATVYEHSDQYISEGEGIYRLNYKVA